MPMEEDSTDRNMETQELDDTQKVYSDIESQDFVDGIMKIGPPDLDVSPNFFLSFKLFHNIHNQYGNFRKQHIARISNRKKYHLENYARLEYIKQKSLIFKSLIH